MARRLKSTPFARFLVAMLFIAPMAYLGAAYYNGEDPIQLVKDKLGIESNTTQAAERTTVNTDDTYDLRQEVENMKERIKELELENSELKEKIRRLELSR
jgi:hypothetical protein